MSEPWLDWLSAFGVTQAIELPIYAAALCGWSPDGSTPPADAKRGLWAAVAIAFGASAVTHPIVWFVIPELVPDDWFTMILVAELFAITAEAVWLRAFGLRQALAWAAFTNAASVLVGAVSRALFEWP